MRQVTEKDMLMVLEDFNGRLRNDVKAWCGTFGKFGPAKQKENSEGCWTFVP